ncbi:MAG: protein-L-isoaspartate(D-aspartate) O-methyltransferase [Burkholderiales bacterium]|nr:protein-L-isoaspartate(D-aspartate) O-methyltransferase [Burkholderiales bacterium]
MSAAPGARRLNGSGLTSERTRARMIERLRAQGIVEARVLAAMAAVPRHIFVDEALAHRAYEETALPIGAGQFISRPYAVARVLELLVAGREAGRVLEVGTGCGYQAAVLAQLAAEVYSIERIRDLAERARANLRPLRLANLRLVYGDGTNGLAAAAPFDSIVVAAAAPQVPQALLAQLAPGGRLVLPLASGRSAQRLAVIERRRNGFVEKALDPVRFVPLKAGTR